MRADTEVTFVTLGEEVYNEQTGNYEYAENDEVVVDANVTDTGTQRMNQLYGGIRQYAKTIRLNERYLNDIDHVLIDGKKYGIDMRRNYRHKTVIEVSGV